MKNLDSKQIGVNELTLKEITKVDGGTFRLTKAGGGIVSYIISEVFTGVYQAYKNDFECSCE